MFIFDSFIGFILTTLFVAFISGLCGGLPFFVWIIMVEMAGQGSYMMAITFLIVSILELIQFISVIALNSEINFNIKSIFNFIKSKLKREKKPQSNYRKKTKVSISLKSFDIIVLIACCILAIFIKPHSLVVNLIYDNLIVRILIFLCIPLIIINSINSYKEGIFSLKEIVFDKLFFIFLEIILGVALTSTVLMLTSAVDGYNFIGEAMESWFVYDNTDYDEIRAEAGFETEYDFLNDNLGQALNKLKEEYDINDDKDYSKIKKSLYSTSDLAQYGYEISDSVSESDDVTVICVVDKKTRNYSIYKINYREYSLTESTYDEMLELKKSK